MSDFTGNKIDLSKYNHNIDGTITCHNNSLILDYNVVVQDHTQGVHQRCFIMTIHDLGYNYKQMQRFVNKVEMEDLSRHVIWIHVNLPGQDRGAEDLKNLATIDQMAAGLICVLDKLDVKECVVMGDGLGANMATEFASIYKDRCLGLIAVDPVVNSAGFIETMKHKLLEIDPTPLNYHNLNLLNDAFVNRLPLDDKIRNLKVDVLLVAGKESPHFKETSKFYSILSDSRRDNYKGLVNCTFLEMDDTRDVLHERVSHIASSMILFLQGVGLLSAVPLSGLQGHAVPSNGKTMEDSDKPANHN